MKYKKIVPPITIMTPTIINSSMNKTAATVSLERKEPLEPVTDDRVLIESSFEFGPYNNSLVLPILPIALRVRLYRVLEAKPVKTAL